MADYDTFDYVHPAIYSGYYRDQGWMLNSYAIYTPEIPNLNGLPGFQRLYSIQNAATGTTAEPDEQSHTPPRFLNWEETKIRFFKGADIVAEFYWKNIKSWSNAAPQTS